MAYFLAAPGSAELKPGQFAGEQLPLEFVAP
jgi:hypothetical protein